MKTYWAPDLILYFRKSLFCPVRPPLILLDVSNTCGLEVHAHICMCILGALEEKKWMQKFTPHVFSPSINDSSNVDF